MSIIGFSTKTSRVTLVNERLSNPISVNSASKVYILNFGRYIAKLF